jgi:lipopolysaccharide transport system permease protein
LLKSSKGALQKGGWISRWFSTDDPRWAQISLLCTLVQRDLEAQYKGSILGNFWPLLNQLSQLLIYTYVFSVILKVKLDVKGFPDSSVTFGMWLFAGLIPWTSFTGGIIKGAVSVMNSPNLVKKVVFPLGLLPLVPVLSVFVESTFGLVVLIVILGFSSPNFHTAFWLLPIVWLPQLLITSGFAYLTAGLTVFLRDIPQSLGVILNLWFYMTPIVYPLKVIPEDWRPWILWLNPIAAIAEVHREIVLIGEIKHWGEWAIALLLSSLVFTIGLLVYRRLRPAFADVL